VKGRSALVLALFVCPAGAQAPPETSRPVQAFEEAIDVRVVNVEAVVTDRHGQRVRGLSVQDFKLVVDGIETPIAFFSEINEDGARNTGQVGSVAAAQEDTAWQARNILVFLDEATMVKARRDIVLRSLVDDLARLGEGDRLAVVAFTGSRLEVVADWSGDKDRLAATFAEVSRRPSQGIRLEARSRTQAAFEPYDWENLFAASWQDTNEYQQVAEAASAAMRSLAAPPGRKIMLLLTEAFPDPLFAWPVVNEANRLGYSLYPVDVKGPPSLFAPMFSRMGAYDAMESMARATGGRASLSGNRVVALKRVVEHSAAYYLLGFSPTWHGDDHQHKIALSVSRPGLKVSARESYTDASRKTRLLLEATSAAVLSRPTDERKLIVTLGDPPNSGKRRERSVALGVPVESLAFFSSAKGYRSGAPVAIVAVAPNGGRVQLPGTWLEVEVKQLPAMGTYARFDFTVKLKESTERIIVTVYDAVAGSTLWGEAQVEPLRRE
jgi:VWFA-related protein